MLLICEKYSVLYSKGRRILFVKTKEIFGNYKKKLNEKRTKVMSRSKFDEQND